MGPELDWKQRPSPDSRHTARWVYAGEVRFGPPYFLVEIDGRRLSGWLRRRVFGDPFLWSDDSRYLALQEWLNVAEGPHTELRVVDVPAWREARVARYRGAFVEPVRFKEEVLEYAAAPYGSRARAAREEACAVVPELPGWRRVRCA